LLESMRVNRFLRWVLPLGVLAVGAVVAPLQASEAQVRGAIPAPDSPDVELLDAEARAHAAMALEPPDWVAARQGFLKAAERGSTTAMSYLGWLYEKGLGVERDGARAAEWYGKAALAGAHDFSVKLGWMYLSGDGVPRDRGAAEAWFGRGIEAGHSPARIAWASVLIADALGGKYPDKVFEARELLLVALDDGYTVASFFLARLYIEGIGGHPVDDGLAARYTRIGADTGNAQMQGWLAFMYLEGRGVDEDPISAAMWANLAAAGGDSLGEQIRQALEGSLAPEEIHEARQRAVAWAMSRR
jgi:uncharacterized protein